MLVTMLYVALAVIGIWIFAAMTGVGKNTVFDNPQSLSDAQIERIIQLTQRIMDNSEIGSKSWNESGDKFNAALAEQFRRRGIHYDLDEMVRKSLKKNEELDT
jgi:hypothetical protein